jgi:hypothetical protein
MPVIHRDLITDRSAWTRSTLSADTSWQLSLQDQHVDNLLQALESSNTLEIPLHEICAENFALDACGEVFERIKGSLRNGHGFSLLHNFPVVGIERADIERMYWGFCAHLGLGLTQNSDASLIHYVTEGRLRPNQGTRGVGDPGPVSLHVDLADCVSLLCVNQAQDSPPSRLSSSMTLHNQLLEQAPHYLARLYEGFEWDRQNEHGSNELPTTGYKVPFFSVNDATVSCRYNRNWIRKAAQRSSGGLSAQDTEMLDFIDALTHENCFEFAFRPGDVQFANNYTTLHGRAPHQPSASDAQARLLMRIWFNMENIRPFSDAAIVRHGILRHGHLGWSAADLATGLRGRQHMRRSSDLAPRFV